MSNLLTRKEYVKYYSLDFSKDIKKNLNGDRFNQNFEIKTALPLT